MESDNRKEALRLLLQLRHERRYAFNLPEPYSTAYFTYLDTQINLLIKELAQ